MEHFALGSPAVMELSVSGSGSILVHGLRLDSPSMKVSFFEGFPVTLTALPVDGGIFTGWSDGETAQTRTVLPGEVSSLTANFK